MLCKALHAGGSSVQVVGMSATLNNMGQLQQFMNARCFQGQHARGTCAQCFLIQR